MDPKAAYGIDLNDPKTINPLILVPTSFHFGYFLGFEFGYDTFMSTMMAIASPIIEVFFIPSVKENIMCSMLFWNK